MGQADIRPRVDSTTNVAVLKREEDKGYMKGSGIDKNCGYYCFHWGTEKCAGALRRNPVQLPCPVLLCWFEVSERAGSWVRLPNVQDILWWTF